MCWLESHVLLSGHLISSYLSEGVLHELLGKRERTVEEKTRAI